MIRLTAGHVSWKPSKSLTQCSFTCLIFLVVFFCTCSIPCLWVNFMYLLRHSVLNRIVVKLKIIELSCILLICYSVF